MQDVVGAARVVEVAHHGEARAVPEVVEQRRVGGRQHRGGAQRAMMRPRQGGAALLAGALIAPDPRQRAPEAMPRRLFDVIPGAPPRHLLAHPRQRVPEGDEIAPRRVVRQQPGEVGQRGAHGRAADPEHRKPLGIGQHERTEQVEEDGAVASPCNHCRMRESATLASGWRPPKPSPSRCQNATRDSPNCQQRSTCSPSISAGKSTSPSVTSFSWAPDSLDLLHQPGQLLHQSPRRGSGAGQRPGRDRVGRRAAPRGLRPANGVEVERAALQALEQHRQPGASRHSPPRR